MVKETSIISVRIDADVKKTLEEESDLDRISLNTLVTQILQKHVQWDMFSEQAGFTGISKNTLRKVMATLSKDDVIDLAKNDCKKSMINSVEFIQGEFSFENFLKVLDLWINAYHVPFRHFVVNNSDRFVLNHNLGRNWALYLFTSVESTCHDLGYVLKNSKMNDENLLFDITRVSNGS